MRIYPAIDVRGGRCVRLKQGDFSRETVYSSDPSEVARAWQEAGASFIHVVDLDGARSGSGLNEPAIADIISSVSIPIQTGGGIRCLDDAERRLSMGAARVIFGTAAARTPDVVGEAVRIFGPGRVVVGIDARDGRVAVEGWESVSSITPVELCARMSGMGVRTVVFTDIATDGMMSGANIPSLRLMTSVEGVEVIASGGIAGMSDLSAARDAGAAGAIIGNALYMKTIDLREAVDSFERGLGA
ncbi:MAG: 1-(5-phosphoribosyl)-5-[(5-phosphoribosylamino)methylideneamino]imidazole-4-carboxamide isomerase [Synergistaceae bacterium]|jgi:phosphoribosylformimino-5-aminoimidazole carboxamide ribotide isomerase|nr:1-(5-phosphoribosyl)-5-[(5-phosphoribosylamino)methylideneamino]imidazole-4-carboxamide isomerase [Synergistaceae bacterium]